mmetsp:Transcript_20985/g.32891  ORF Transcript_20985/g.32891 Transcript_20985/m.32891 type:complete len:259 (+) Transcript_20985:1273-2049(+)
MWSQVLHAMDAHREVVRSLQDWCNRRGGVGGGPDLKFVCLARLEHIRDHHSHVPLLRGFRRIGNIPLETHIARLSGGSHAKRGASSTDRPAPNLVELQAHVGKHLGEPLREGVGPERDHNGPGCVVLHRRDDLLDHLHVPILVPWHLGHKRWADRLDHGLIAPEGPPLWPQRCAEDALIQGEDLDLERRSLLLADHLGPPVSMAAIPLGVGSLERVLGLSGQGREHVLIPDRPSIPFPKNLLHRSFGQGASHQTVLAA